LISALNTSTARRDAAPIWAITSYFNPCGYQTRLSNYRIFHELLAVPLVTVELSFDGHFELTKEDADILVQIEGHEDQIMWQKERLLNIAIAHVPDEIENIAWLDCDIVFSDPDWPVKAGKLLERFPVLQLFKRVYYLEKDQKIGAVHDSSRETPMCVVDSLGYNLAEGRDINLHPPDCNPGMAWAARKDFLLAHGIYDGFILGGGDRSIPYGVLNLVNDLRKMRPMCEHQIQHFAQWAQKIPKHKEQTIPFLDANIFHLFHGPIGSRHYAKRHQVLKDANFNPCVDIALDDNGCWRWNSKKPDLHEYARNYFYSRNEDQ
jgi:hypothetical protein